MHGSITCKGVGRSEKIVVYVFSTFPGISSVIGVIVYGAEQGKRGIDTLSWAYVVAIFACVFMVFSAIPQYLEVQHLSLASGDQIPILPRLRNSVISQPGMPHSSSVDSCIALRTLEAPVHKPKEKGRPRSESQVRMRVNSINCPPTPMPGDFEEPGAAFNFDNDCFTGD